MNRSGSLLIRKVDKLTNDTGTTLVEYGLILLLIAVVVVLVVKMVGESTNNLYSTVNNEIVKAGS